MKIEEAPKATWTRLRTEWFILTADFCLDETAFPTCEKVDSPLWLDEKIPYEFFMGSILSENLSKYEIKTLSNILNKLNVA